MHINRFRNEKKTKFFQYTYIFLRFRTVCIFFSLQIISRNVFAYSWPPPHLRTCFIDAFPKDDMKRPRCYVLGFWVLDLTWEICPWKISVTTPTNSISCEFSTVYSVKPFRKSYNTRKFTKRVREMSSQLFITVYTRSIHPCTQTAETTSPKPFSLIPLYINCRERLYIFWCRIWGWPNLYSIYIFSFFVCLICI